MVRHEYYSELSQGNRVRTEPIPAARGLILDRNGEVVAANQPAYQLELVPEEVPNIRATLARLVALGLLRPDEIDELMRTIDSSRSFDSVPIRLHMSDEDVARFAVRRFEFRASTSRPARRAGTRTATSPCTPSATSARSASRI